MNTIGDILTRDLSKKIEEVIQVNQVDEQSVYDELTEYVATDRIKDHYRDLLKAMAEAPSDPSEGIGIWISGFFGSGKSSFAKNLGYVLSNPKLLGEPASELFKEQVKDQRISEFVDFINVKIPTEVVMFDVSKGSEVRRAEEKIAEIVYRALLTHLDYATDYDVAELEIELEEQGKLEEFVALSQQVTGLEWNRARKGAMKLNHASAILHQMNQGLFPAADSWAKSLSKRNTTITIEIVVKRTFELTARRKPNRAIIFIIDEVGRYVAYSANKIEDLRALVEEFGKVSKNYLKAGTAIAPVWVVVTSQEKLDEVVDAIGTKRVDIAKLQDRFKHRIDLAPADIREVATKRVLAKKPEAEPLLRKLFGKSQGQLNAACKLERTQKKTEITEKDFVQFYPYLPHYIQMSIDIMSGIRLQPGAPRHLGGSNRTIIKQAYEMLVSERTSLAKKPIGTLVTLDKIFELVEGNLSSEKQKDISDIAEQFGDDPDGVMVSRVAKTLALLEFVRDLPRTETNIAACLVDMVGQPAPKAEVERALTSLVESKFVRNTEEGWKLQTAQEKNWETERRAHSPRPKDRNEITRETLRVIFEEPGLKNYRYRGLRTFRIGINVDGAPVNDGDVALSIITADDAEAFATKLDDTRTESRETGHKNDVYWVFPLTPEIDALQANIFASRQMILKYEQQRAQNKITNEESSSLSNEKTEVERLKTRIHEKTVVALESGQGLFQGVSKDAASLGRSVSEIFKGLFDYVFPELYPKLEMGARHLSGNEVEEILKAANLSALSLVFYDNDKGLHLVTKDGDRYVPNPSADAAKEILDFLKREHSYGNKVTGKILEQHFAGLGYGWDTEVVRLVLAVLMRAGSVEVTYQGRRLRSYQDPQSRTPFVTIPAFRSASFSPRESIGLKALTTAVQNLEELSGEEVDIEEGAIASAFKKLGDQELKLLLPVIATVQANGLPGTHTLEEYRQTLVGIETAASDDCVRILAGEGKSFKEARDRAREIREAISSGAPAIIRGAKVATNELWPALARRAVNGSLSEAAETLQSLVTSLTLFEHLREIENLTQEIAAGYRARYAELHEKRTKEFSTAIDEIRGRPEWELLKEDMRATLLAPLTARACDVFEPTDNAAAQCSHCGASLNEMESDLAALGGLKVSAIVRLQELTAPSGEESAPLVRVKLSDFFIGPLDSETSVNEAVERLRDHLLKLTSEGARIIVE